MKLLIISFLRDSGWIKSGWLSMYSTSLSWYFESRRKYACSLVLCTSLPQSGHLPSTSCVSVQKDSQGVQYQPSYSDL